VLQMFLGAPPYTVDDRNSYLSLATKMYDWTANPSVFDWCWIYSCV